MRLESGTIGILSSPLILMRLGTNSASATRYLLLCFQEDLFDWVRGLVFIRRGLVWKRYVSVARSILNSPGIYFTSYAAYAFKYLESKDQPGKRVSLIND